MRNISVMIEGNSKELYLNENLVVDQGDDTVIKCVKATVFWKYKNVIKGVNDTFVHDGNTITVPEGYWTAGMIKKIRTSSVVYVGRAGGSAYYYPIPQLFIDENGSGRMSVYSSHASYTLNMGTFGTLLGFDKNFNINPTDRWLSQKPADLNRGLRYVTVSCDIVDEMKSSGIDGKRSSILTILPLPLGNGDIDLGKASTQYEDNHNNIPIKNGSYNKLIFDVSTNIGDVGIGDILLELNIGSR